MEKRGTLIESIEELRDKSKGKKVECFIALNGGVRSSKDITYFKNTNTYVIHHNIDGEKEVLSEKQFIESFTGEALEKKALYEYN